MTRSTSAIAEIADRRVSERAVFLSAAYVASKGSPNEFVKLRPTAAAVGIDGSDAFDVISYLSQKGLVRDVSTAGEDWQQFRLTANALDIVERLHAEGHAPSVNVSNSPAVNGDRNVTVVATDSATVSVTTTPEKWWESLPKLVRELIYRLLGS